MKESGVIIDPKKILAALFNCYTKMMLNRDWVNQVGSLFISTVLCSWYGV